MKLDIKWYKPIPLLDGDNENLIYTAKELNVLEGMPGVYMFCRIYNSEAYPLYIGKAENIAKRILQHFKNSTKLMNSIKKAANGTRIVVPGRFVPRPGQNTKKCIAIVERALISYALAEGYELFNVQGTKTPTHHITFSGFLGARNITGKEITAEDKG